MMINKLTEEQERRIPEFIDKWVNKASEPMNHEKAIEYTKKMYVSMKGNEPIIIFGNSPLNTALLCSLFWCLLKNSKVTQLNTQLNKQIYTQLDTQLSAHLITQLSNQLSTQLNSHLYTQLSTQLNNRLSNHLYTQLNNQIYTQLCNQLDTQFSTQLNNQLNSQLNTQLNKQIYTQLDTQLSTQLDTQLYTQLYTQLSNQIYTQLNTQLNTQLCTQLSTQLYTQLDTQLSTKLYTQFSTQLNKQLNTINSHWYLGLWWLTWCGLYEYGEMIGFDFDHEKYDLFVNFNSEIHFIIPYKGICFISEKPKEIHWENKNLHKDGGLAVEYPDGYGMYCLNGVKIYK
jgi:DNA-binding FadR family transcriptional regulator